MGNNLPVKLGPVSAKYQMNNIVKFIKLITADELIVSDRSGNTAVISISDMKAVHKLDIGSG